MLENALSDSVPLSQLSLIKEDAEMLVQRYWGSSPEDLSVVTIIQTIPVEGDSLLYVSEITLNLSYRDTPDHIIMLVYKELSDNRKDVKIHRKLLMSGDLKLHQNFEITEAKLQDYKYGKILTIAFNNIGNKIDALGMIYGEDGQHFFGVPLWNHRIRRHRITLPEDERVNNTKLMQLHVTNVKPKKTWRERFKFLRK